MIKLRTLFLLGLAAFASSVSAESYRAGAMGRQAMPSMPDVAAAQYGPGGLGSSYGPGGLGSGGYGSGPIGMNDKRFEEERRRFEEEERRKKQQAGFVPGLDLNLNQNQNNQKHDGGLGGLGGGNKGNQQQEARVDLIPENLIATEAIVTVDVPSDHMRQCVGIRMREYSENYNMNYYAAAEGTIDAAQASARKKPTEDMMRRAMAGLEQKFNKASSTLLSFLNQAVKEGQARKLRDQGANFSPIYDYGCAYKCDYSNPMTVGYSAHQTICFDARLSSASSLAKQALNYGATDMESMNHVASEKQQLKGELIAVQRATAEAFLKAQAIAHALFLIQGNKEKHLLVNLDKDRRDNSYSSSYSSSYDSSFGGYGYGSPLFDDFFYDDRYDSGRGFESNKFFDDFFHQGSFFNKGAFENNRKHDERARFFQMPELFLVKIACKRIDENKEGKSQHPYPLMKRSDSMYEGVSMMQSGSSAYGYEYYYPMPQMMTPVAIEVTVKCDLITRLEERNRNQNKHDGAAGFNNKF